MVVDGETFFQTNWGCQAASGSSLEQLHLDCVADMRLWKAELLRKSIMHNYDIIAPITGTSPGWCNKTIAMLTHHGYTIDVLLMHMTQTTSRLHANKRHIDSNRPVADLATYVATMRAMQKICSEQSVGKVLHVQNEMFLWAVLERADGEAVLCDRLKRHTET